MAILSIHDPRWIDFIRGCPDASPFHHPAWATLLAQCYGYRPMVIALTDTGGRITAAVPAMDVGTSLTERRWVSLPFTDSCPLLTRKPLDKQLAMALTQEVRFHGVNAYELRGALPEVPHVHAGIVAVRHTLILSPDAESVYQGFSKMHRRNALKAHRSGVTVEMGRSPSDVAIFYRLHLLTRRRLGVPVQPRRFFRLLGRRVLENHLGFVSIARIDGTPVAAAVFLAWNGVLVYKYGASDSRYWSYRPNNLLFEEVIRWGCENDYHTLDWGRTDLGDRGLREFKSGWGAREEPLTYAAIADSPPNVLTGGLEKILSPMIRHSPLWVCQAAGEVLYRYAPLAISPVPRLRRFALSMREKV